MKGGLAPRSPDLKLCVAMTAATRPQYLAESLESWAAADGIEDVGFLISVEPGNPEVEQVARDSPHKVIVNEERLGVLANPHRALTRAFDMGAEFAILAEDDVIVSNDVISYFRWTARRYHKNANVLMVGGFSPWGCSLETDIDPMEGVCSPHAVHRGNLTSPTPWGVWKRDWPEIGGTWQFDYQNRGFDHYIAKVVKGTRDIIRPCASRAQHIGKDNGAHCTPDMFPDLLSRTFRPEYPPGLWFEANGRFPLIGPSTSVNVVP